jgi:uncharacterized membrane protein YbhN (UPF0104 family)
MLGLGLFISTVSDTQQQSMFLSWFFLVIFVLLSGLFTPIDNMPRWAQMITWFNPVSYFVEVIRMVLLKGSGFAQIAKAVRRHRALRRGDQWNRGVELPEAGVRSADPIFLFGIAIDDLGEAAF